MTEAAEARQRAELAQLEAELTTNFDNTPKDIPNDEDTQDARQRAELEELEASLLCTKREKATALQQQPPPEGLTQMERDVLLKEQEARLRAELSQLETELTRGITSGEITKITEERQRAELEELEAALTLNTKRQKDNLLQQPPPERLTQMERDVLLKEQEARLRAELSQLETELTRGITSGEITKRTEERQRAELQELEAALTLNTKRQEDNLLEQPPPEGLTQMEQDVLVMEKEARVREMEQLDTKITVGRSSSQSKEKDIKKRSKIPSSNSVSAKSTDDTTMTKTSLNTRQESQGCDPVPARPKGVLTTTPNPTKQSNPATDDSERSNASRSAPRPLVVGPNLVKKDGSSRALQPFKKDAKVIPTNSQRNNDIEALLDSLDALPSPIPRDSSRNTPPASQPGAFAHAGIDAPSPTTGDLQRQGTITIGSSSFAAPPPEQGQGQEPEQSPSPPLEPFADGSHHHTNSSDGLVEANLVTPSQQFTPQDLEAAEPMDQEQLQQKQQEETKREESKQCLMGAGVGLFLGIVLLVIVLLATRSSDSSSSQTIPDTTPTVPPTAMTAAPTQEPTLALLPKATQSTILQDPDSPQARAYNWTLNDPNLDQYSNSRILQRFALATFYFATKGEEWHNTGGGEPILVTGREPDGGPKGPPGGRDPGPSCSDTPFKPGGPDGGPGGPPGLVGGPTYLASSEWLTYDSNECFWYSSSMAMGKPSNCDDFGTDRNAVVNLHLQQNNVQGILPPELGLLTALEVLSLEVNGVSWTIPTQLGLLHSHLKVLRLSKNKLKGSIPSQLGRLSKLEHFGTLQNELTGTVPAELWNNLSHLRILQIGPQSNPGAGTIPDKIGELMPALDTAMCGFSGFTGTLPTSLGLLTNLTAFDFNEGFLTGTIPTELAKLTRVERIFVARNNLTGSIPSELAVLPNMGGLWVDGNTELGGTIPSEFAGGSVQDFKVAYTSISGTIPEELCAIGWMGFECSDTLCGCDCCPCS